MLYLKTTRKEKEKREKRFYVESNGQNGLHYLMLHSNVQKAGQNVYNIFLTWRPYAAGNSVRQKSARTAVRSGENSARISGTGCQHPARSLF